MAMPYVAPFLTSLIIIITQNLDSSFNFLSVCLSGLVSGVTLKRILVPLFPCGFAPRSSQQDPDLFQRQDIYYGCSHTPAGPCARADPVTVPFGLHQSGSRVLV